MPPADGITKVAIVAPFANERMREWSLDHFRTAIGILTRTHRIHVVGTGAQRFRANMLVRGFAADIVENRCGRMRWVDVVAAVDAADMVIANNSGIAHLAASRGTWTLCVFAGSHQYEQWRPIGPRAVTITLRTTCSPCILGAARCPNGLACMADLDPAHALALFEDVRRRATAS